MALPFCRVLAQQSYIHILWPVSPMGPVHSDMSECQRVCHQASTGLHISTISKSACIIYSAHMSIPFMTVTKVVHHS